MSQNYYYLVAGLSDLVERTGTKGFDYAVLRQELFDEIDGEDRELIRLLQFRYDNHNLISLLKKTEAFDPRGWLTQAELEEALANSEDLPAYMLSFLEYYREGRDVVPGLGLFEQIMYLYYTELMARQDWLASWVEFDLNVRNVVAATAAKRLGLSPDTSIVPANDIADRISKSHAQDFGLGPFFPWIEPLLKNFDDPIALEEVLDTIYWQKADEITTTFPFTIESILCFMVRINSIERWVRLDAGRGTEQVQTLLKDLKSAAATGGRKNITRRINQE